MISEIFGIEGGKLLTPDDDLKALKNFTEKYYGAKSSKEEMHLEYQRLLKEHPDLEKRLDQFPMRIFSGKKNEHTTAPAVFFCYSLPAEDSEQTKATGEAVWTHGAGDTAWLLFDVESESIVDDPAQIIQYIRSKPKTPRHCSMEPTSLTAIREKLDKHLTKTYLRKVQAPVGVKPILRAWMEIN